MKQFESVEAQNFVAPQPRASNENIGLGLGQFALGVGFLFTVLFVGGMIADRQKVTLALVCGAVFFTFLVVIVVLSVSGQLAAMVINGQNEKTKREYSRMQYSLYMREPAQLGETVLPQLEEREPPQRNFVPARPQVDERVRVSAYEFINNLYLDGVLDPDRVLAKEHRKPGQIQWPKPRKDVLEYLLALGMVREGEGQMLFFNYEEYDTLEKAKLAVKHNVPVRRL